MKKYGDRNYAPKNRKVEKGDIGEYCNRSSSWKASKTSSCNSLLSCQEEQKEVAIECYGKFVQLTTDEIVYTGAESEIIREEDVSQTHQEGRSGIQESDQGRYETKEENTCKTKGKKMKKQTMKERKHESKETKAYEKKEDKKESKSKKK